MEEGTSTLCECAMVFFAFFFLCFEFVVILMILVMETMSSTMEIAIMMIDHSDNVFLFRKWNWDGHRETCLCRFRK